MNTPLFLSRMLEPHEKPSKPTRKSRSSQVTSFRLRNEEVEKLKITLPDIVPDNAHHLLSRKVVRDFIDGRLVYLNRQDRLSSRITA